LKGDALRRGKFHRKKGLTISRRVPPEGKVYIFKERTRGGVCRKKREVGLSGKGQLDFSYKIGKVGPENDRREIYSGVEDGGQPVMEVCHQEIFTSGEGAAAGSRSPSKKTVRLTFSRTPSLTAKRVCVSKKEKESLSREGIKRSLSTVFLYLTDERKEKKKKEKRKKSGAPNDSNLMGSTAVLQDRRERYPHRGGRTMAAMTRVFARAGKTKGSIARERTFLPLERKRGGS